MEKKNVTKIVTIKDLWEIFVHRLWIIVLAAAISASGLFAFVSLTFVPQYSSTATMYILRQANENVSSSEASSDFSLALKVVNDCDYLLKSVPVLGEVMNTLDLSSEYEDMEDMAEHITTFNPADTRILEISIEASSPEIAKNIVDALGEIGAKKINDAMGFDQVNLYALGEVEYEPCNKTSILTYILVGIVAANQATKEAAAMANGFTGIMGYLSTTVSGIGVAFIKTHYGWGATLCSFAVFALIGMVLFLFAWNAGATGYRKAE
jgi:capsular polysaccharide biosynthesis protein